MGISSSGLLGVTLAVVLALPLSAQESCEPAEGSAALEGGVHETAAGVALPGATVVANWSGVRTEVVADGDGRFALCDLPAGEALRVQAKR